MAKGKRIVGVLVVLSALGAGAYFLAPHLSRFKKAASTLIFSVRFNRIHSLKFPSPFTPLLKLYFDVSIRNFSGYDIAADKVSVILEYSPDGGTTWENSGSSPEQIRNVALKDGTTVELPVPVEIKGMSVINALSAGGKKLRVLTNYEVGGLPMQSVEEIDTSTIISAIKAKMGLNGLSGSPVGMEALVL